MIKRVVIVGTGLLGCSLGLALKKYVNVEHIFGIDIHLENAKESFNLGIVDGYAAYQELLTKDTTKNTNVVTSTAQSMLKQADWVILAIPVCAIEQTMIDIRCFLKETALLSDLGSTKQNIVAYAQKHLSKQQCEQFIPLHPIAGSEKHGPSAAKVDLFLNKPLIITPFCTHASKYMEAIEVIWQKIGANISYMQASKHDDIFAAVSHLPHILAFALMQCILDKNQSHDYFRFIGSGFKDFTRIAASSPHMWTDIIMANQASILLHLDAYIENLHQFRSLIHGASSKDLFDVLSNCANQRKKL
jgi:prephenate dehydrogenase